MRLFAEVRQAEAVGASGTEYSASFVDWGLMKSLARVFVATVIVMASSVLLSTESHASARAFAQAQAPAVALASHVHRRGRWYRVRPGDTLSKIARRAFGSAGDWQVVWWKNRGRVRNPDVIKTGMSLWLSNWHPDPPAWLLRRAAAAIPKPKPARAPAAAPEAHRPRHRHWRAAPAPAVYTGGSGFQACVISRESGGNPRAVNLATGAGGLYQFLPSTWHALGFSGLPEYAPVWEQNEAFQREYAQSGAAAWAPYDGC